MSAIIIQSNTVSGGGVTSLAASWPAPTTAGNTLIAVISVNNSPGSGTFTPPAGWVKRANIARAAIFDIVGSASRSGSETFGLPGSNDAGLWLFEVANIDTANPYDGMVEASGTSSIPAVANHAFGIASGFVLAVGASPNGYTWPSGDTPTDTTTWTAAPKVSRGIVATTIPAYGAEVLSITFGGTAIASWDAGLFSYNVVGQTSGPLQASAGDDQQVEPATTVSLVGVAQGGTGPYTYAWTQTAGPAVTLSDPSVTSPSFTAPADVSAITLTFSLSVTDATSTSTSDSVNIEVANGPFMYRQENGVAVKRKLYRRTSGTWQWPW